MVFIDLFFCMSLSVAFCHYFSFFLVLVCCCCLSLAFIIIIVVVVVVVVYSSPSLKQKPPLKPKPVLNMRAKFTKDAIFKETPSSFDDVCI